MEKYEITNIGVTVDITASPNNAILQVNSYPANVDNMASFYQC